MAEVIEKHLKKRTGSENNNEYEGYTLYRDYDPPGSPGVISTSTKLIRQSERGFTGWNIPNFHKRKRSGELMAQTPWFQYGLYGTTEGEYSVHSGGNQLWYYEPQVPTATRYLTVDEIQAYAPATYDQYVQAAAAAIYTSNHDTLTFIAELADTKRLFRDVIRKIMRLDFPNSWKKMSSEWLASRYGWRTLIYDLQDLSDALSRLDEKRKRYSESRWDKYSSTFSDAWSEEKTHYYRDRQYTDKVTISLRGSVVADLDLPKFSFNPLITGWELIRFSFIIDWLITVGKAIAAGSFLALQYSYSASAGYRIDVERSYSHEIGATKSSYDWGTDWALGEYYGHVEVRSPCRVPLLPRFALNVNYLKVMDLVALLIGAKRR